MHGPLFFKFEVTPLGVEELVHMHSITAVETIPVVISGLSDMVSKKVSWWKPYASLSLMKKYLVWYNPRSGFGDWQMRFLAVDGGQAYFITTGNFDTAAYAIDPKGGKE